MNCPRCGSQKTSRTVRKVEREIKKVVDGKTILTIERAPREVK